MPDLYDPRDQHRLLAVSGLIAGPLLFLISTLISPAFTVAPEEPHLYLERVAASPDLHLVAAGLFLAGALAFLPGLMGTMHLLRGRSIGFGQVAVALIVVGMVTVGGFYVLNVVQLEMIRAGADREQMAALLERVESGMAGMAFLAAFGAGIVIGPALLAIVLLFRRAVPVWGPVALLASVVMGFLPDNKVISAIEFVLLLVGTSAIALRIWTLSPEAWARWQPLPERRPSPEVAARRARLQTLDS